MMYDTTPNHRALFLVITFFMLYAQLFLGLPAASARITAIPRGSSPEGICRQPQHEPHLRDQRQQLERLSNRRVGSGDFPAASAPTPI